MNRLLLLSLLLSVALAGAPALADEKKPLLKRIIHKMHRGACLAVGVASFPVLAPLNYVAQTALVGVCYSRGDWRTAAYIIQPYDWYWLDRW